LKQIANSDRNGSIDYLRFISAIGIVWFHTHAPGKTLAYTALPCFIAIMALYGIKPGRLKEAAHRRATRLLGPWLKWSLVYTVASIVINLKRGEPPFDWFEWAMVAYGPWIHLWFLPFAFFVGVLLAPLLDMTAKSTRKRNLALSGILGITLILILFGPDAASTPISQWIFGIETLGVCLPLFFSTGSKIARFALSTSAGLMILVWHSTSSSTDATAVGLGVFSALVANKLKISSSKASLACSKLSLHIYLVHPLLIFIGYWFELTGTFLGLMSVTSSVIVALIIEGAHSKARTIFNQ
jgi:surface polysaccharide O-acyltransferase-like enzyme